MKIPVVFLDRTSNDSPSVYADGKKGGRLAAQEIIARGSKKITVIQGPAHIKPAQDRFLGAIEVLNEMGISYNVIQTSSFSHTVAEQWAVELFAKYIDTDGVIASNDIVATAVIHEAHRLGKECRRICKSSDSMISRLAACCHLLYPPFASRHMIWVEKRRVYLLS